MSNPACLIWQQITKDTKMAVGARDPFAADEGNTLQFSVTIQRGKRHKIEVHYDQAHDAYNVKLWHIRGVNCTVEKQCDGVYVENLNSIIYDYCNKP